MKPRFKRTIDGFLRDEDGMVTHFALTTLILVLIFSGMSLDTTNAWRTEFILQTAADAAARAAVLELPDENTALDAALELATANLTSTSNTSAITLDRVTFGNWDAETEAFSTSETPTNAVLVTATRSSVAANALPTFLLRLVGFNSWNIEVQSIAYRSSQGCDNVDISANGTVSFAEDNDFYKGYCVEAATELVLADGNQFDDDNILYVESTGAINFSGGDGLSSVIGRGTSDSSATLIYSDIVQTKSLISAPFVSDVSALATSYLDPYYESMPDYINTSSATITLDANDVETTNFQNGRIYEVLCGESEGSVAEIADDSEVSEVVIVSECSISVGANAELTDVVLVSLGPGGADSVITGENVALGDADDCAEGGGVSIYAAGGVTLGSDVELNGVYVSSTGSVTVDSAEDGVHGVAIDADGDISFSATAAFGTCNDTASVEGDVSYLLVK
ncbi:MAG: TadG family pilus assembly protein [Paracoccaceae bacterium]